MKKRAYILLILPCFALVTVFLIFPLITMIFPTFLEGGFTFSRYVAFLSDPYNLKVIGRSVRLSLITTLICALIGFPTAYFISTRSKRIKGILSALVLFPLLTNSVIRGFAWITILGKNGVINSLLVALHLIPEPAKLLYTEMAIVVGSVYLFLPLMITTLTSIMDQLESETVEAAQSLGANSLTVFRKVILPLCFSGLIVGSVLVFSGTMSAYTTPSMLGGNKNMMLATLLYQQANSQGNWLNASLIALIMIVITMVLMNTMNWIARRVDQRGLENG